MVGYFYIFTEKGAVGLLQEKKAINIVSRGGDYSSEPFSMYEMGDRYLKTIFAFYGITDFATVALENLNVMGQDVEVIVDNAIKTAQDLAENF